MKIELKKITVRELTEGYKDNLENGVVGYGGRLDIRPPYQREFIYGDRERNAVIETLSQGYPLNVMYWAQIADGRFEMIDGQQRTISICQYVMNVFSVNIFDFDGNRNFYNLQDDEQEKILNYELMVYWCSGTDSERLKWFETINIAGKELTPQELKNAVYAGPWVTDARRYFSKRGCPASAIGSGYLTGDPLRQEYLETAIRWISGGDIRQYMIDHQHDANAGALWRYFQDAVTWIESVFTKKRKFMKGVDWGPLYEKFNRQVFDSAKMEDEVARLVLDDDVAKKSGIYPYLLTGDETCLSIRKFSDAIRQKKYEEQNEICTQCKERFDIEEMEADHITPWCEGGKTVVENCQMLCRNCNRRKSSK